MITPEDIKETQEIRSKLREDFLKATMELNGKLCSVLTYEQTNLKMKFGRWKPDGSEVLVRDFQTPARLSLPTALLRTTDLLAIEIEEHVCLP